MAYKQFAYDIDLLKVSQLRNTRIHNVTTTERTALDAVLNGDNEGLHVWDTTEKLQYYWDGTQFVTGVSGSGIAGAMVYKGAYSSLTTAPTTPEIGYTYVFTGTAGDLTWADQTFFPSASIQPQDSIIYRGGDIWDIYEGNNQYATEITEGNIRLASNAVAIAGTDTLAAITAAALQAVLDARMLARVKFINPVTTVANTPLDIVHNLNLQNKDAYTISIKDSNSEEIEVFVKSIDQNTVRITTAISMANLKVTIIGY